MKSLRFLRESRDYPPYRNRVICIHTGGKATEDHIAISVNGEYYLDRKLSIRAKQGVFAFRILAR